ncbi:MAG: hypothetical protein GXP63_06690 [DPANN group archaeon]|nr:hypothetical protein [DPANN group archaeon]
MDSIVEYILAQRKQGFDYEAIKKKLRAAGHDPVEIEEAFIHINRQHRHRAILLLVTILIIGLGTLVALNLNSLNQYYDQAVTYTEDEHIDMLQDMSRITTEGYADGVLQGKGFLEMPIQVKSDRLTLEINATGIYCQDPPQRSFVYEGKEIPYDYFSESIEVKDGNIVRHPLTPAEKEQAIKEDGWPILLISLDGETVARAAITSADSVLYDVPFDASSYNGRQSALKILFSNPCRFQTREMQHAVRRKVLLDGLELVQHDAVERRYVGK